MTKVIRKYKVGNFTKLYSFPHNLWEFKKRTLNRSENYLHRNMKSHKTKGICINLWIAEVSNVPCRVTGNLDNFTSSSHTKTPAPIYVLSMTSSNIVRINAAMTGNTEPHVISEVKFNIYSKGSLSNHIRGKYWKNIMVARTKSANWR